MVNVTEATKLACRQDSVYKQLRLEFANKSITTITNTNIIAESLTIDEILCANESLHFGECNASKMTFSLANITDDFYGEVFTAYLKVNNEDIPLGKYTVTEVKDVEGKPYRNVTAMSIMERLNQDITDFYDSLQFPITLKRLRDLVFEHVGIEQEEITLAFDDVVITKNWIGSGVYAKAIIEGICELNGYFGVMGRDGVFKYVSLRNSPTLDTSGILKKNVIDYAFTTNEYDGVIVIDDYGTMFKSDPETVNPYIINNNVCLYGLGEEELQSVVSRLLPSFKLTTYTPVASCVIKGQPYVEIGDKFAYGNNISSYVLKRSIKGVQALTDTISASGTEYSKYDRNSVANQLGNLNRSTGRLKIDMSATQDGVKIAVSKSEEALEKAEEAAGGIEVGGVNLVDKSIYMENVVFDDVDIIEDENGMLLSDENENILYV